MNSRGFVLSVVGILAAVVVLLVMIWAGVRVTEADREHRTARTEACLTLENQSERALCIAAAKP